MKKYTLPKGFLVAAAVMIQACNTPPLAAPEPTTAGVSLYAGTLPTGDLSFPGIGNPVSVAGGSAASAGSAPGNTGASNGSTSGAPDASTASTVGNGGGSSGGGGASDDQTLVFDGFLSHPTFASGSSGLQASVSNETELRAALADHDVTNIDLTADIDLTSDGITRDLIIDRGVALSGFDFELRADSITVTGDDVVLQAIEVPNAFAASTVSDLVALDCTFGANAPAVAVALSGCNARFLYNNIAGGSVGIAAENGTALVLTGGSNQNLGQTGIEVNDADITLDGGVYTNGVAGLVAENSDVSLENATFNGTSAIAISMTTSEAGHSLAISGANSFTGVGTAIALSGTSAAAVSINGATFINWARAIDFGYAFNAWSADIDGNQFSGLDASSIGIEIDVGSATPGLVVGWLTGNDFLNFDTGRELVVL